MRSLPTTPGTGALPRPSSAWATWRRATRFRLVRREGAGGILETMLVAAVAAVLAIRAFLAATGYPQVGGGGLHVAHLLWGGLLMLVALVLLLAFLGDGPRRAAAIVGGAGFGTFVDELGKFITSDNDYFFRPTVGLLYVLFVVLFVLVRTLDRGRRPLAPDEALANATDQLRELVLGGASDFERARVLRLLAQSNAPDALAAAARAFVAAAPSAPAAPDTLASLAARVGAQGRRTHDRLVGARWFGRAVVFVFVANAVLGGAVVLVLGLAGMVALVGPEPARSSLRQTMATGDVPENWPAALVAAAAALANLVCCAAGALRLRRSRVTALRWFRRGVLLSLLLAQPIGFLNEQFGALSGLAWDLVLWGGVGYLLRQEIARTLPPADGGSGSNTVTHGIDGEEWSEGMTC